MRDLLALLLSPLTAVAGLGRWFARASVAARLAVIVGVFQFATVVLATVAVLFAGEWAVLQLWWSPGKVLALLALLLIVPLLVFHSARLWFDTRSGRWPEISTAWAAAVADLQRQGIVLAQTPLVVVLGSDSATRAAALFADAQPPMLLSGSPGSGGPLHVYASNEVIYVCLDDIGLTAVTLRHVAVDGRSPEPGRPAPEARREAGDRLTVLAHLLAHDRAPLVPINGVLVVMPLDLNHASTRMAGEIGTAVAEDLGVLVRELGVRPPLTLLGTGLEQDPATPEFFALLAEAQRPRVNADRTVSQPTGREVARGTPFPTGISPSREQLEAVAINAVGPIIDALAEQVSDPARVSSHPANRRLLALLCRLRLHGATQLLGVLEPIFPGSQPRDTQPLLAGCFVAALSSDATRRGFLAGVLERVVDQQAEIEWTEARWRADGRASRVATALFAMAAASLVVTGVLLWWKFAA